MLRRLSLRRCAATAAAPPLTRARYSFSDEHDAACEEKGNVLASPEYAFLRDAIAKAEALQKAYAVKQTEMERTRKAAAVCGLGFRERVPRKSPSNPQ